MKDQQPLSDEKSLGKVGDVSGDLGTDPVRKQSAFPASVEGVNLEDVGQLDAWLASEES